MNTPKGFVLLPDAPPKMGAKSDWLAQVREEFNGVVCDWSVVDAIYEAIIHAANTSHAGPADPL
jgi:hypothetical protein